MKHTIGQPSPVWNVHAHLTLDFSEHGCQECQRFNANKKSLTQKHILEVGTKCTLNTVYKTLFAVPSMSVLFKRHLAECCLLTLNGVRC